MIRYAITDLTSRQIIQTGRCPEEMIPTLPNSQCFMLPDDGSAVSALTHYEFSGSLVAYTPEQALLRNQPPNFPCRWDVPTMAWIDMRTDEQLAAEARAERDQMLKDSDWTQLPDAPLTAEQVAAWVAYRDELRNLTSQAGFPRSFTLPVPPA